MTNCNHGLFWLENKVNIFMKKQGILPKSHTVGFIFQLVQLLAH